MAMAMTESIKKEAGFKLKADNPIWKNIKLLEHESQKHETICKTHTLFTMEHIKDTKCWN